MKQYYELVEYEKTEPVLEGRYGVIYEGEDCIDSSWWNGLVFIDSVRQVKYWLKLRPVTGILMSKEEGDKWISVKDRLPDYEQVFPKKVQRVLILMNYEKWGRNEERIEIANLHFADEPQHFGGPNSLTGQGYLTGLYYSIPAIINPECVTHWQPLPSPPKQALNQLNKQL